MSCLERMDWDRIIILMLDKIEILSHVNFEKLDNPPLNYDVQEYASGTAELLADLDYDWYERRQVE